MCQKRYPNHVAAVTRLTRLHVPRIDVREVASNDNPKEYLPTLIDGDYMQKY